LYGPQQGLDGRWQAPAAHSPITTAVTKKALPGNKNAFGVNSADIKLGCFEPMNNTLFDLE
jgi:hypothetical protein